MLRTKVHLSTIALTTIGLFDLVTSLYILNQGFHEGNPLFAWLAGFGSFPFAIGKILFLAIPITILEYARLYRPRTADLGSWIAFGAYVVLYIANLLRWQLHLMAHN